MRKLNDPVLQEIAKHVMFDKTITDPCRARWLRKLDQTDSTLAITDQQSVQNQKSEEAISGKRK